MSVYRFKVTFEDYDEIYREVEIKSNQTFEEFHHIILKSVKFDSIHNASFFVSDDYWRKGEEILLNPEPEPSSKKKRRDDEVPKKLMKNCKMASLMDDPHQKFVYMYDQTALWTFMVELIRILPDDASIQYPRIAKSVDDAPPQYKMVAPVIPAVAFEDDDDFDEEEPEPDENDAYLANDDDDLAELEGEEGEPEMDEDADELEAEDYENEYGEGGDED